MKKTKQSAVLLLVGICRMSQRKRPFEIVLYISIARARIIIVAVVLTRAPDAGAWGPPVLRGECE